MDPSQGMELKFQYLLCFFICMQINIEILFNVKFITLQLHSGLIYTKMSCHVIIAFTKHCNKTLKHEMIS